MYNLCFLHIVSMMNDNVNHNSAQPVYSTQALYMCKSYDDRRDRHITATVMHGVLRSV